MLLPFSSFTPLFDAWHVHFRRCKSLPQSGQSSWLNMQIPRSARCMRTCTIFITEMVCSCTSLDLTCLLTVLTLVSSLSLGTSPEKKKKQRHCSTHPQSQDEDKCPLDQESDSHDSKSKEYHNLMHENKLLRATVKKLQDMLATHDNTTK